MENVFKKNREKIVLKQNKALPGTAVGIKLEKGQCRFG